MSKLEVDAIEPQSGTTLTIGASGDSVNIASGATITDFTSTGIDDNATSTAITIDSSENVGINTASPTTTLDVSGTASLGTDQTDFIKVIGGGGTARIDAVGGNTNVNLSFATKGAGVTYFWRNGYGGTESMSIDGSGNVSIGNFSLTGATAGFEFNPISTLGFGVTASTVVSGFSYQYRFYNPNGQVGYIATNGSATQYITSSDYRLKENVNYDFDATTRLKQLKPARFNFIADANTTVDGFLAHEVSSIVPEAITGTHNETETKEKVVVSSNGQVIAENIEQTDWEAGKIADEEGNTQYPTDSTWEATKVVPVYQGIDQSKLVPLLVKTIQELEARITALENA